MTSALPKSAIDADAKLEGAATKASEGLAKHRWHWTLDDSNPNRVSIREYARAVSRHHGTIQGHAHGYALWTSGGGAPATLNECIERARMGAEQEAVTEAVAASRGVSFGEARKRGPEVRRTREIARERAEKHGTTVEEEARKVADWTVRSEKAARDQEAERQSRHSLRFVSVEANLHKALSALTAVLTESRSVPWTDEERDLLTATVANVRSLLNLVDLGFAGTADVDWDAELARISGGE